MADSGMLHACVCVCVCVCVCAQVVDEVTDRHDKYDFNAAGICTYNFFWDEFADWCACTCTHAHAFTLLHTHTE